jgi:hypothetical protein
LEDRKEGTNKEKRKGRKLEMKNRKEERGTSEERGIQQERRQKL